MVGLKNWWVGYYQDRTPDVEMLLHGHLEDPHWSVSPFSALFGGSVCVVRGLGASSVTFCHYNRDVLFQLPVAAGPATLPDDPICVETWLSPELRLMTQDNNGISIRTDQWVKYDLSLHACFWIFGT